ncbi:UNVERIFIED_CONTAM: Eukaryotic translation initiation factor 4B1 [Sesamum latifolium]|uniref:Eukaryotic translation initiation factor 4B1 n=1 Tax=Sesamum latifolium TaxID=2727402 RepID=A0AAW2UX50_9LAMI
MKKQTVPEYNSPQARPGGKYSSLGGGGGPGVGSRADEVDNWASVKKPISQPQQQSRSSTFGSGFSRPEPDRWARNEQRLVSDSPKIEVEVVAKVDKPNPFGAARPREEVLAEKGLDWKKLDSEIEGKKLQHSGSGSRPSSSQSSRPGSPLSSKSEVAAALMPGMGEGAVKQKPKVNPFGDAKPREVLLEEKGLDWKKIDLELEHRRVERCLSGKILASTVLLKFDYTCAGRGPETEEEKNLKEEIEHLKKELLLKSGDDKTSIHDLILQREGELELLVRQLDDKVRYSQKNFERPGSGAGRGAGFNERPPSRPGASEEPRAGFNDRPPSMPGAYEEPRAAYTERPRSRPGMYEDPRQERPPSWGGQYEDPRSGFAERPRSRPGAYEDPRPGSHERPRSRQGAYEDPRGSFPQRSSFTSVGYQEPRAGDYNERPRSRGTTNSWTRSSDDRRAIQGGGGRGFLGSRDVDSEISECIDDGDWFLVSYNCVIPLARKRWKVLRRKRTPDGPSSALGLSLRAQPLAFLDFFALQWYSNTSCCISSRNSCLFITFASPQTLNVPPYLVLWSSSIRVDNNMPCFEILLILL